MCVLVTENNHYLAAAATSAHAHTAVSDPSMATRYQRGSSTAAERATERAIREAGRLIPSLQETGRILGKGAYGEVVEVRVNGRKCAAKKLHGIFSARDVPRTEKVSIAERFEKECLRVLHLNHPNVVEMIGVFFDRATRDRLPTLVMELLDTSLNRYLDDNPCASVTPTVKCSILLDVATGLVYLHSLPAPLGPIVHRDLTANNVLLAMGEKIVAKIADLGQAKNDPAFTTQQQKLSKLPGNEDHMPPEAWIDEPVYNVSLDIFSFGVVMLHTLAHEWPKPLGKLASVSQVRKEVDRRKKYLDKIESSLLKPLVIECLSDAPESRPVASEVLGALKLAGKLNPTFVSMRNETTLLCQHVKSSRNDVASLHQQVSYLRQQLQAQEYQLQAKIAQEYELQEAVVQEQQQRQTLSYQLSQLSRENQKLRQEHGEQSQKLKQDIFRLVQELEKLRVSSREEDSSQLPTGYAPRRNIRPDNPENTTAKAQQDDTYQPPPYSSQTYQQPSEPDATMGPNTVGLAPQQGGFAGQPCAEHPNSAYYQQLPISAQQDDTYQPPPYSSQAYPQPSEPEATIYQNLAKRSPQKLKPKPRPRASRSPSPVSSPENSPSNSPSPKPRKLRNKTQSVDEAEDHNRGERTHHGMKTSRSGPNLLELENNSQTLDETSLQKLKPKPRPRASRSPSPVSSPENSPSNSPVTHHRNPQPPTDEQSSPSPSPRLKTRPGGMLPKTLSIDVETQRRHGNREMNRIPHFSSGSNIRQPAQTTREPETPVMGIIPATLMKKFPKPPQTGEVPPSKPTLRDVLPTEQDSNEMTHTSQAAVSPSQRKSQPHVSLTMATADTGLTSESDQSRLDYGGDGTCALRQNLNQDRKESQGDSDPIKRERANATSASPRLKTRPGGMLPKTQSIDVETQRRHGNREMNRIPHFSSGSNIRQPAQTTREPETPVMGIIPATLMKKFPKPPQTGEVPPSKPTLRDVLPTEQDSNEMTHTSQATVSPSQRKSQPHVSPTMATADTGLTSESDQSRLDYGGDGTRALRQNLNQDRKESQGDSDPIKRERANATSGNKSLKSESAPATDKTSFTEDDTTAKDASPGNKTGFEDTLTKLQIKYNINLEQTWVCSYCTNLVPVSEPNCDVCYSPRNTMC